jgi:streptomycin 6-kinase
MATIRIPPELLDAVDEDDHPERCDWLDTLPATIGSIAAEWGLDLGEPYIPGGQCAWVAPARNAAGDDLVLKVGWRHRESEHEAEGLLHWAGAGAVRCVAAARCEPDSAVLLLERCLPGTQLARALPEDQQDAVIAALLRRLWEAPLPEGHPFGFLEAMCTQWAEWFEIGLQTDPRGLDPGLARAGAELLRTLPGGSHRDVLLCTDLHAGNVLAAQRETWLVIDPKPFVGDPAFDAVQHMLNCDRLDADPVGLARRMAGLLEAEPERVGLWLLARCIQESLGDDSMRPVARRLAAELL